MRRALSLLAPLAILAAVLFGAASAHAQPCQWNYSVGPDGNALATYCGNVQVNGSLFPSTGSINVTRAQIPTTAIGANQTIQTTGYRTVGDHGAGAFYTSVGATSNGIGAVQDINGVWFNLQLRGVSSPGYFGSYGDGAGETMSSSDIAANAWARGGPYTAGVTTWDQFATEQAIYTAFAGPLSGPGTVVWNSLNSDTLYNLTLSVPCGDYFVNRQLLSIMANFTVQFQARGCAIWDWRGTSGATAFLANSALRGVVNNMTVLGVNGLTSGFAAPNTTTPLVSFDHTGTPAGLATQQLTFNDLLLEPSTFGNGLQISRSGGSAQGDTITLNNPLIQGTVGFGSFGLAISGQNALSVRVQGGDIMGATADGVQVAGGTVYIDGTSFQGGDVYYPFYPQFGDITNNGADLHILAGCGPTCLNSMANVRSEDAVPINAGPFAVLTNGVVASGGNMGLFHWTASQPDLLGTVFNDALSDNKLGYIYVADGGLNGSYLAITSMTSSVLTDSTASYTVNQFAGGNFDLDFRYSGGFVTQCPITANTATTITYNGAACTEGAPVLSFVPTSTYSVTGLTGSSPPTWTGVATGKYIAYGQTSQGFSTTANSTTLGLSSGICGLGITSGDFVVIAGGDLVADLGNAQPVVAPLIASVSSIDCVTTLTATLSKPAKYTLTFVGGYWGTPTTDGQQKLINLNYTALSSGVYGQGNFAAFGTDASAVINPAQQVNCASVPIGATCSVSTSFNAASTGDVAIMPMPLIGNWVINSNWLEGCANGATGAITGTIRDTASGGGTAVATFTAVTPPAANTITRSSSNATSYLGNTTAHPNAYWNISSTTASGTCKLFVSFIRAAN